MPVHKIDKENLAKLLNEGKTIREITQILSKSPHPVCVSAVRGMAKKLLAEGKVKNIRMERKRRVRVQSAKLHKSDNVDYDTAIKWLTVVVAKAQKSDSLEQENWRLKNQNAAKDDKIKILEDDIRKWTQRKQEFNLAIQEGVLSKGN